MRLGWWQVLPVGPTGYQDSPYQSPSTFAGNPLLIDLVDLCERGLVREGEMEQLRRLPQKAVDYGALIPPKKNLLGTAADRFLAIHADGDYEEFRQRPWLDDYAAFAALKEAHGQIPWTDWDEDLALRKPRALASARRRLTNEIERHRVIQYLFFRQWEKLRSACHAAGIGLIGDLPIFVAHDSADVWANRGLFHLDPVGRPTVVAGVPPDYFSATGQRWGNPLYRWDVHREQDFQWWTDRLAASFALFDRVRIDHFRGFAAYWEIPSGEDTAVNGHWVEGPGAEPFLRIRARLGKLPIIAEDLGIITDDVTALRTRFGFPGMRVAQFGFDTEDDTALHNPANYPRDVVAYTGTHDNDTTVGWFWGTNRTHDRRRLTKHRRRLLRVTGTKGEEIHWDLIGLVMRSAADLAIIPVQDLLGLGTEARMNTPGIEHGNWTWRLPFESLPDRVQERMGVLTKASGRAT